MFTLSRWNFIQSKYSQNTIVFVQSIKKALFSLLLRSTLRSTLRSAYCVVNVTLASNKQPITIYCPKYVHWNVLLIFCENFAVLSELIHKEFPQIKL